MQQGNLYFDEPVHGILWKFVLGCSLFKIFDETWEDRLEVRPRSLRRHATRYLRSVRCERSLVSV